jgi:hypothetical protein
MKYNKTFFFRIMVFYVAGACSFGCHRSPKIELWGELGFPIRIIELWASPTYVESSPVSTLVSESKQARFLM